jgi:hypothetical protein
MKDQSDSLLDLLVSGRILSEGMYGLIQTNPEDLGVVLFSSAFSPAPDNHVICHWVPIPKSAIARVDPLGIGYCCGPPGLPVPRRYSYVRLWLMAPQDAHGAAIAELLSDAQEKIAKLSSTPATPSGCGCAKGATPAHAQPGGFNTLYGDISTTGCPVGFVRLEGIFHNPITGQYSELDGVYRGGLVGQSQPYSKSSCPACPDNTVCGGVCNRICNPISGDCYWTCVGDCVGL